MKKLNENLREKTDQELYENYLEGNEYAFNEIVFRYQNPLIYFISRYTRDIEIAEDISQDVFVYLLLNKQQYNFSYSFKTYLYMIAKCRAFNYLKREKRMIELQEEANDQVDLFHLEDEVYQKEEAEMLQKAMRKMTLDYQTVLYLSHFEGFKYREIAQIMDKNMGQVKILINRAKKKLKQLLEKEGFSYDEQPRILK